MKTAIYVRTSTKEQEKKISPEIQTKQCKALASMKGLRVFKVYKDAATGRSMDSRRQLQELLRDAEKQRFRAVIVWSISRFGRNVADLSKNVNFLKDKGIVLYAVKEPIDSSSAFGKMMIDVLGALAELESTQISERTTAAKTAYRAKGIPSLPRKPYARIWVQDDKITKEGHWEKDDKKAKWVEWAAEQYLAGGSLKKISSELVTKHHQPLSYNFLLKVFKEQSGTKWITKVGTFEVPRLLEDSTISKIQKMLKHNRATSKPTAKKDDFVLRGGFLRCYKCGKALTCQRQNKHYGTYPYYRHTRNQFEKCKPFNQISAPIVEREVFNIIFENVRDEKAFEEAIAKSIPEKKDVAKLEDKVKNLEKDRDKQQKDLDRLVQMAIDGTLAKSTIQKREQELTKRIFELNAEIESLQKTLQHLPSPEKFQREAKLIRLALQDYFQTPEYMARMSFQDRRRLVHQLFPLEMIDGEDGRPYGIFVERLKKGWRLHIKAVGFLGEKNISPDILSHEMRKASRQALQKSLIVQLQRSQ